MTDRSREPRVREADEADVAAIQEIFACVYGKDYPHAGFLDQRWLKRSVFNDDILMLVAEEADGTILGTASVVFDIGSHSDLTGEFGRLAVHPAARGRGLGRLLMEKRVELSKNRLHVGIVGNRTVHPFSQRISNRFGFAPVGYLPLKHLFSRRESIALYARHFGAALRLRCNHPRIVPEAHPLAHVAMENCGLSFDAIVDEDSAPYPHDDEFDLEELTAEGLPALIRIERGRVHNREVFGPMRLQYGFFALETRRASYLIARQPTAGFKPGTVAGAVGYIHDPHERTLRVFELITRTDHAIRFLFNRLLEQCQELGAEYVEVDVSAHAPRMQRTLLELGFLPAAYVPAMVFHDVERLDVVKMVRLLVPLDQGEAQLTPGVQVMADLVLGAFTRQAVLPRIAAAVDHISLFEGLNEEQRTRVAGVCTVAEFSPGERLFTLGEEAERMLIIIEGEVGITLGDPPREVGRVGSGEPVGEVSLLTGEPHFATAASGDGAVQAAALSRAALKELTRQRPDIGGLLYRNLAVSLGRKLHRLDASLALRAAASEASSAAEQSPAETVRNQAS